MTNVVGLDGRPIAPRDPKLTALRAVETFGQASAENARARSFAVQLEELARTNGVAATREMCERVLARLERDGWK